MKEKKNHHLFWVSYPYRPWFAISNPVGLVLGIIGLVLANSHPKRI